MPEKQEVEQIKETKYLKAFYKLDGGDEMPFETNGENLGNWGTVTVEQNRFKGDTLQIVVHMANFYSADKVILDEVSVSAEVNYESGNNRAICLSTKFCLILFPGWQRLC